MAIYYLAIAFLIAHELDAVTHSEWRLLFVLRDLQAAAAAQTFVALHVPLVFLLLWFSHHPKPQIADWTRSGVALFLVVHAALHLALSGGPEYDFNGVLSRGLILCSAAFGVLYLIRRWQARETMGDRS